MTDRQEQAGFLVEHGAGAAPAGVDPSPTPGSPRSDDRPKVLAPSRGRRKHSGQAALATRGDGWGDLSNEWGYHGVGPYPGPDVVLAADANPGPIFDGVTRAGA